MNAKDQTKEQRIGGLRELHKPSTFDAWLSLGGDYRDLAEAQEWASRDEINKLSLDYTVFREKMEHDPVIERADAAQSRQWSGGARRRRDAVWEIPCQQVGGDKK